MATLTLNRPNAMNSFDADTARAIVDAVEAFAADDARARPGGGGEGPVFSAGGDFNWVLTWPELDAITRQVGADAHDGRDPGDLRLSRSRRSRASMARRWAAASA